METYYPPKDLPGFQEMGEETPESTVTFFSHCEEVFAEEDLTEREKPRIGHAVAIPGVAEHVPPVFRNSPLCRQHSRNIEGAVHNDT